MRILVVNPNSTAGMTDAIARAATAVAAAGTEIEAITSALAPASIEGYFDGAFAVPGLLAEIVAGERRGLDAAVIACFDDTGLDAARSAAAIPVVGLCEAALKMASSIATRIAIVTSLPRSIAPIEANVAHYGLAHRVRVRASGIPVLDLEHPTPDVMARLAREIEAAITQDRAEAIVLGCAGMAELAADLTARYGLPVIDGVAAAVKQAEALVGLGLRTSKIGAYASPTDKAFAGALAGTFAASLPWT